MAHADRSVDKADDLGACGRCAVGIEQTVYTEVSVMSPLAVVAAVRVASVLMKDRVIDHLPYTASDQVVVFVDLFPVSFRVAGSDAHSMCVLAHEIRSVVELLLLTAVLTHIVDHLYRRIHLAAHIICDTLAMDSALVVNRQIRLEL